MEVHLPGALEVSIGFGVVVFQGDIVKTEYTSFKAQAEYTVLEYALLHFLQLFITRKGPLCR